MDTNVFVSNLKSDDPYHKEANLLVNKMRKGQLGAETSVLTLLEIASVAGRLYQHKYSKQDPENRKIFVIKLLKMFSGLHVRLIHLAGDVPLALGNIRASVPSIINESILIGIDVPLRTLDLVHIAAARSAKQNNSELEAFVTGDAELLSMGNRLLGATGMPLMSPREYLKSLT